MTHEGVTAIIIAGEALGVKVVNCIRHVNERINHEMPPSEPRVHLEPHVLPALYHGAQLQTAAEGDHVCSGYKSRCSLIFIDSVEFQRVHLRA